MKTKVYRPQNFIVDTLPNWLVEYQQTFRRRKIRQYRGLGYNFHERNSSDNSKLRIESYLHYMIYHAPKNVQLRWESARIKQFVKRTSYLRKLDRVNQIG